MGNICECLSKGTQSQFKRLDDEYEVDPRKRRNFTESLSRKGQGVLLRDSKKTNSTRGHTRNRGSSFLEEMKPYKERVYQTITLESFKTHKVLGKGAFGKVYLVSHVKTNKFFAMKVLRKKEIEDKKQQINVLSTLSTFETEAKGDNELGVAEKLVMQKSNCPFIVRLWHTFQTPSSLILVMDYLPGGEVLPSF